MGATGSTLPVSRSLDSEHWSQRPVAPRIGPLGTFLSITEYRDMSTTTRLTGAVLIAIVALMRQLAEYVRDQRQLRHPAPWPTAAGTTSPTPADTLISSALAPSISSCSTARLTGNRSTFPPIEYRTLLRGMALHATRPRKGERSSIEGWRDVQPVSRLALSLAVGPVLQWEGHIVLLILGHSSEFCSASA